MKPVKDIVGPASSYGFKVFVVAFFKFQGKNVTEYSNYLRKDRHTFCSNISLKNMV